MKAALIAALLTVSLFAQDKPLRDFSEPDAPQEAPKTAQPPAPGPATPPSLSTKESEMRTIAERFAPIIYQRTAGTADQRRFD